MSDNLPQKIPEAKIRAWVKNNLEYRERKDGDELVVKNPFNGSTNFKMNINPHKGVVHCWTGDEWAGPINPKTGKRNCSFVKFVKLYKGCSFPEAIRDILGSKTDISQYLHPSVRTTPDKIIEVALPKGTQRISDSSDAQAKLLRNWLAKRGYTSSEIDSNDLYHLGMEVYWPYYEFDTLVYWQSRNRFNKIYRFPDVDVYDTSGNKIGKTDGSKSHFLYGFDDCQLVSYVIVTESIFCKHSLGEQSLASGGAQLSEHQLKKIKMLSPSKGIILSPDNDKAGINSVISNFKLLKNLGYPMFYSIPPKIKHTTSDGSVINLKDWNEFVELLQMDKSQVRELHDKNISVLNSFSISKLYSMMK